MKKVLAIVGPTAVGKTATSIKLAKKFNGEIISGDSMQVYRKLDIGTAKITEDEKQGIVHHLINIRDIDQRFPLLILSATQPRPLLRSQLQVSCQLSWAAPAFTCRHC